MALHLHNPQEHLGQLILVKYVYMYSVFILYVANSLAQLCLHLSNSCQAFWPVGSILWPADDKEDQVTNWLSRQADGKTLSSIMSGQESLAKKENAEQFFNIIVFFFFFF